MNELLVAFVLKGGWHSCFAGRLADDSVVLSVASVAGGRLFAVLSCFELGVLVWVLLQFTQLGVGGWEFLFK